MTFTVTMYPAAPSEAAMTRSQAQRPRPDSRGQYFQPWRLRREETTNKLLFQNKNITASSFASPGVGAEEPEALRRRPPAAAAATAGVASSSVLVGLMVLLHLGGSHLALVRLPWRRRGKHCCADDSKIACCGLTPHQCRSVLKEEEEEPRQTRFVLMRLS